MFIVHTLYQMCSVDII